MFDAVEELTARYADSVPTEVPIIEHPRGDDPFIISMALKAVVLTVVPAKLGLAKD